MTSIVLLNMSPDLDETITRTTEDDATGSGNNLNVGDTINLYSALRNLMLPSSNVTTNMIARVYGSQLLVAQGQTEYTTAQAIAKWVEALNRKAVAIGMTNTIFATPSGLDTGVRNPATTTIIDMLKMTCYAVNYPDLQSAMSEPAYAMPVKNSAGQVRTVNIVTTVIPLVASDKFIFGGKTGTVTSYGFNMAEIAIMDDGRKVALITLGAANDSDRTTDIRSLMSSIANQLNWNEPPGNV